MVKRKGHSSRKEKKIIHHTPLSEEDSKTEKILIDPVRESSEESLRDHYD